ncbi:TetR family transcriptional regulator C-terminal domain-containing protein [Microbacterium sp. NEAU-LLC]|uniref:TetR family transcriptional regulator C-terminal domain-containing protein n=1 Tax=Microbacterium helvum TaxID=2773713 RepID=A0ABR8NW95_9MICO|nr:TetR family transcriptional regulator C-terminal domain-containing protein [Microbacterium helvum]MBD3943851.1 TetR family transcriptional regulator C-terminal domain-containing protein [Microbacterium helvum]
MPKIVDHDERRRQIADAVYRVTARSGLDAVSLRHVAAEAGVTAGMVQHYFPSKDDMLAHAMEVARQRYEERFTAAVAALGPDATPRETLRAILRNFIPRDAVEIDDGRVSLAFQAYAATRDEPAERLAAEDALLHGHLSGLVEACAEVSAAEASLVATGLLATAEGLGLKVLSAGLASRTAVDALDHQLARVLGTRDTA